MNARLSEMLSRLVQSTRYKCSPFLNTRFSKVCNRYIVESLVLSKSLVIGLFLLRLGFRLRPLRVAFVVDKATLEYFSIPLLRNSPVIIIASRYHRRHVTPLTDRIIKWHEIKKKDNRNHPDVFFLVLTSSTFMLTVIFRYMWERPTRCTLFLNNLFKLNYPRHVSKKIIVHHQEVCTSSLQYFAVLLYEETSRWHDTMHGKVL